MIFFAEDNDLVTFFVEFINALLHFRYDGAGSIDHPKPKFAHFCKCRWRFAVRANENFRFDTKLAVFFGNTLEIGVRDRLESLRTQTIHFHRIMNNIAKRIQPWRAPVAGLTGKLRLGHIYGPHDAPAKSRIFIDGNDHCILMSSK